MPVHDEMLPLTPLSMAILLALADRHRHGYALMRDIETQTEGALKPGTGSLYAALERLEEDGLIREAEGEPGTDRRRRYFALTDAGRSVARAETRRLRRVLDVAAGRNLGPDTSPAV